MRIALWATISAIVLWTALHLIFTHLPRVGGGSLPYETYIPHGGGVMLLVSAALVFVGIVLVVRKARTTTWLLYAATSVLPLMLLAWPAWYELRYAEDDWIRRWEGSDIWGHIEAAKISWFFGALFTVTLLNIFLFGYFARRSEV